MVRKGYTPEQIINKLREAEILLSQWKVVGNSEAGYKVPGPELGVTVPIRVVINKSPQCHNFVTISPSIL